MEWIAETTSDQRLHFWISEGGKMLPNPLLTGFQYEGHQDQESDYGPYRYLEAERLYRRAAAFRWEDITFQCIQEWFIVPSNRNLLAFRQTLESSGDCCYHLETWVEEPDGTGIWSSCLLIDQEDNSCGLLLEEYARPGIALCETTQLVSASVRISESRHGCSRSYDVTAWKETPVKLEKYISLRLEDNENFRELAFAECRQASKLRFDALLKGAAVSVTKPNGMN